MKSVRHTMTWALWSCGYGCGQLAEPPTYSANPSAVVTFEPELSSGCAAPILHIRLAGLRADSEPPVIVEGKASRRNIQDLAQDDVSAAFRKRMVPTITWRKKDGSWVIAPRLPLLQGETYSVIAASSKWSREFTVLDHDDTPVLSRYWPPAGASGRHVVWCVAMPARGLAYGASVPLVLSPGVFGMLGPGAIDGVGSGCVHWTPEISVNEEVIPPPVLQLPDGRTARVEPAPILLGGVVPIETEPTCVAGEVFGPACADVRDDRAVLSTDKTSWLLTIRTGAEHWVSTIEPQASWVLKGLEPASNVHGDATFVSPSGWIQQLKFAWATTMAQPHVVINEIMANPVGPEPAQEWLELFNDGIVAVSLLGWSLEDAGGVVELPNGELPPGAYAVIVGDSYDIGSWVDVPPAPGSLVLRVPSVGKTGLSNAGEPVRLLDNRGATASVIPAIPSKRQGWSIARWTPEALDNLSSSFALGPDGGSPGERNTTVVGLE